MEEIYHGVQHQRETLTGKYLLIQLLKDLNPQAGLFSGTSRQKWGKFPWDCLHFCKIQLDDGTSLVRAIRSLVGGKNGVVQGSYPRKSVTACKLVRIFNKLRERRLSGRP